MRISAQEARQKHVTASHFEVLRSAIWPRSNGNKSAFRLRPSLRPSGPDEYPGIFGRGGRPRVQTGRECSQAQTARFSVPHESRRAHSLCTRWVPGCVRSRPQAGSVATLKSPPPRSRQHRKFFAMRPRSKQQKQVRALSAPMGIRVYSAEAVGREHGHSPGEPVIEFER